MAEIWTREYIKIYGGIRTPDHAICTLCVQEKTWESYEVSYGRYKMTINLVSNVSCDRFGHRKI